MNQELLNQFLSLLEASSSFKLLSPEQQGTIRKSFSDANDEQLQQAIQALKEDHVTTQKLAEENAKKREERAMKIARLETVLRKVKKNQQIKAEATDNAKTDKEMEGLLRSIDAINSAKSDAPKKRKKFLGLF